MKTRILFAAGVALLALAACSRRDETTNRTGVTTGAAGLQVNSVGAAGDCMSPSDMNRPAEDFTPEQRVQLVSCINAAAARQVNAQLPRQMDEVTRLDRLTTEGPLLIYNATILRPASSLSPGTVQQVAERTRTMVCAQPQMRETIRLGGAYGYRWVDNQGVLINEIRIDAC